MSDPYQRDEATRAKMAEEKESAFRQLAASKLSRLRGLTALLDWIDAKVRTKDESKGRSCIHPG